MNVPNFYNWAASQPVAFLQIVFSDARAKALAANSAQKSQSAIRADKPLTLSAFAQMSNRILNPDGKAV